MTRMLRGGRAFVWRELCACLSALNRKFEKPVVAALRCSFRKNGLASASAWNRPCRRYHSYVTWRVRLWLGDSAYCYLTTGELTVALRDGDGT